MKILVTSGGTTVPIDSVRSITNMSKGTFGARIALAALEYYKNNFVTLFRAENSKGLLSDNINLSKETLESVLQKVARIEKIKDLYGNRYEEETFKTFEEYYSGLDTNVTLSRPNITFLAAAVSDYTPTQTEGKIQSSEKVSIDLNPNPKIIKLVKKWVPETILVGFKLLVNASDEELVAAANKSIKDNGCDMVVANDISSIRAGNHRILIVRPGRRTEIFEAKENLEELYLARKIMLFATELYERKGRS